MFNIMDIIVILIILISVFVGYKKGFIKTIISLLSFFVAIGMALLFYKPFAVILTENTRIDDWIIENIVSDEDKTEEEKYFLAGSANTQENENIENNESLEKDNGFNVFLEIIDIMPNTITNSVDIEEIKDNTREEIAYKISELIMNLFSLILIYVVVKVTLLVAMFVLDGIMKIPVLKQINEICGMAVGAVIGFTQIYVSFAVITFISSICDISNVISMIKVSAFARILFENNLIINLLF